MERTKPTTQEDVRIVTNALVSIIRAIDPNELQERFGIARVGTDDSSTLRVTMENKREIVVTVRGL